MDIQCSRSETGQFFEMAGKVVGQVISEDDKTLLVRKGRISAISGQDTLTPREKAEYISTHFVNSAYWIKLQPATCVAESVDCVDRKSLIGEFLNVQNY